MGKYKDNDKQQYSDTRNGGKNNFDRVYDANQYGCYPDNNYSQQGNNMQNNPMMQGGQQEYYQPPGGGQNFRQRPYELDSNNAPTHNYTGQEAIKKAINNSNPGLSDVIFMLPKNYVDVKHLIDNLRDKQAVIVNLAEIDAQDGQRVLDFLSGAIYALGGSQQRIAPSIFLFTPCGVAIKLPLDFMDRYKR